MSANVTTRISEQLDTLITAGFMPKAASLEIRAALEAIGVPSKIAGEFAFKLWLDRDPAAKAAFVATVSDAVYTRLT